MAGTDYRTVNISGNGLLREYSSAAILTVGMICEHATTAGKIQVSSGASAINKGGTMLVTEAPERGKGIYSTSTTENTYAITEQVPVVSIIPGNKYLVLLLSGEAITVGEELEVNNAGKAIAALGTNMPAFTALEAMTPSQDALILVEAL
jgi:hypothetical protein